MYMTEELLTSSSTVPVSLMSLARWRPAWLTGFTVRQFLPSGASIVRHFAPAGMNKASAVLISIFIGFTYMTANLIQFDFAARVCPPRVAATVFALLMALSNCGMSLSILLGGYLYEFVGVWWGARISFNLLVLVGAVTTGACWLLMPWLARHAQEGPDRPAAG
jgi:MFS family permease